MSSNSPSLCILLGLYNGARFLQQQLESFARQSFQNWDLIVSDDGSTDESRELVQAFAAAHPGHTIRLIEGPGMGFAQNFMYLLKNCPASYDYVAFSDQDDVWLPEKLERAIGQLEPVTSPAMIFGRTTLCDEHLKPIKGSPHFKRPPSFQNALVQNIGGGNTMVINQEALQRLQPASRFAQNIPAHDWWCYQICSGIGATVLYDAHPTVLYRQHGGNQIGSNISAAARIRRIRLLFEGRYSGWLDANITALEPVSDFLTPENACILEQLITARKQTGKRRLQQMKATGVYRQTKLGNVALWLACAMGHV